jgi:hypothetical protein
MSREKCEEPTLAGKLLTFSSFLTDWCPYILIMSHIILPDSWCGHTVSLYVHEHRIVLAHAHSFALSDVFTCLCS